MAQTRANKAYYTFNAGINTDASLINFPENFSTDEENFLLDIDGSRSRRRGLSAITPDTGLLDEFYFFDEMPFIPSRAYRWDALDKETGTARAFIILQDGVFRFQIYDGDVVAPEDFESRRYAELDLYEFLVDIPTFQSDPASFNDHVSFATGNGQLFICFKHMQPIRLEWDKTGDRIDVATIDLEERDFVGNEDGLGNTVQPAALSATHEYNLVNRGWKKADIDSYFTAKSVYPAKNMIPWLGYRRESTAGIAESDWTKAFSPDKLQAELFQDASAPQGHSIRSPFDTGSLVVKDTSQSFGITTWTTSTTTTNATATITVTTDRAHGMVTNDKVWIEGQKSKYLPYNVPKTASVKASLLDGEWTLTAAPTANTLEFTITWPQWGAWVKQYAARGTLYIANVVTTDNTVTTDLRPSSTAWYAGRVWYAGIDTPTLRSKVFFSQVIEQDGQYGKCYQVTDPTDERINLLVATDGGCITIPEMVGVKEMVPHRGRLLLFAENGVWEVSGGSQGYFTADDYTVSKISETGCTSGPSVVIAEDLPMYLSEGGIYVIQWNRFTERLESVSLSAGKVDNLLKTIPSQHKDSVQVAFDKRNKRVWWLYADTDIYESMDKTIADAEFPSVVGYNCALVYDMRFQAFQKVRLYANLGSPARGDSACVFAIHALENTDLEDPIIFYARKYKANAGSFPYTYGEYSNQFFRITTDPVFEDFGLYEEPAFLVTGYDTLQDASVRKYPIYVTCYLKKTETGYTASGTDFLPVNEGSLKLQARWDWADNTSAGKWSPEREVYRHSRLYFPTDATDEFNNGQPLVVTKNKVRGTGRAMHLKFTAGTASDAKILGWQVLYAGTSEP